MSPQQSTCRACEYASTIETAPVEIRRAIAGATWVAAFLGGVSAGARGADSVEAARAGLCETHQKVGDIICETFAALMPAKAESLPAPAEGP